MLGILHTVTMNSNWITKSNAIYGINSTRYPIH